MYKYNDHNTVKNVIHYNFDVVRYHNTSHFEWNTSNSISTFAKSLSGFFVYVCMHWMGYHLLRKKKQKHKNKRVEWNPNTWAAFTRSLLRLGFGYRQQEKMKWTAEG